MLGAPTGRRFGPSDAPDLGARDSAAAMPSDGGRLSSMRALAVTILTLLVGLIAPPAARAFGPLGEDFRISFMGPDGDKNSAGIDPSVAYNPSANEYLVVWLGEGTAPLAAGEFEVFAQRVSASGALLGGRVRVSDMGPDGNASYTAGSPSVAYNPAANEYLVTWDGDDDTAPLVNDEFEIFAQRVSASGALLGGRIRVSDMGPNGSDDYRASAASVAYNPANDQYLVTWRGDDNTAPLVDNEFEIFGQQLTAATGGAVGVNDFRISDMGPNGNLSYVALAPSVAYNSADSLYLITWGGDDDTAQL